ncbi:MAG: signal peptidase I [Planctomycetales bacterium]|nr:signal peptidase I [Planctomycetales bacterium]
MSDSKTSQSPNAIRAGQPGATQNVSAAPPAPPPRQDSWRETIESIVVAFILAFLFRSFEAEAFVIPTGSMAPTLNGRHKDVHCEQCGYRFSVGASDELQEDGRIATGNRVHYATCPSCRYPNNVLAKQGFNGDRILVNKFPYDFGNPDRWDVVVFKYPEEAHVNYIKRLVGLPNEQILLDHGDVKTRQRGKDEAFRIARKEPDKQRMLQQIVYDNDHPEGVLIAKGWPERWAAERLGVWSADAEQRAFRADPDKLNPDEWSWIRYRHIVPSVADWERAREGRAFAAESFQPQLITDFYAYNARVSLQEVRGIGAGPPELSTDAIGEHWVGDLTMSGEVELFAAEGEVLFEVVESRRRYRCQIDLKSGRAFLFYLSTELDKDGDREPIKLAEFDTPLKKPGTYHVRFANVDDRLCFWVDDRLLKSVDFDEGAKFTPPAPPFGPTDADLAPIGIAARGAKLRVAHLRLDRDIYYVFANVNAQNEYDAPQDATRLRELLRDPAAWSEQYNRTRSDRANRPFELKEDEFFVLGDNSPRSKDSRLWNNGPVVPRRLMIGKAFYSYWPHGIPFLNSGNGFAVSTHKERGWDNDGQLPPSPALSLPFYPDVSRMRRIR